MIKVFWDDPYQTHLVTEVVAIEGQWVQFDKTIAFSFSGGQESDKAFIDGHEVVDSKIEGQRIWYLMGDTVSLRLGQSVEMTIDWPRRYRLMRLHFAAELILEMVTKAINVPKIGAHISEHKARIDFNTPQNISHLFDKIDAEFREIIDSDLPIIKDFSDREKQLRYWEIDGFARVPCGGTHVRSTKEVGYVKLKRVNLGKNKERIEISLL